jgi:LCP family protein required for cell wall assembly
LKKKNPDRVWNLISVLILAVLIAAQGLLLWQIQKLNMLPGKYFLLLCGGCLVLTGLISLLMLRKKRGKWQKRQGHGRQVIGYLLSLLLLVGCCVGSYAVGRVQSTVSSITAPQTVKVVLEIYVRAEDPAGSIQDTAGYTYALPQDITEAEIAPVVAELEELLQGRLELVRLANATAQLDALFAGEVDAVVLNSAYLTILEETEGYEDYAKRVKLLHETVVEKEVPKENRPSLDNLPHNKPEDSGNAPERTGFLCYLSGIDSRHNINTNGRSDVNILVAVNPQTHQILMVNTPRDYYVINPISGDNSKDKLTHCGVGGVPNSMEALGTLYGHHPEYYARINFSGFETLVDAIGGVTIYSDIAFPAGGTNIYQGENHLNGVQALEFARERKNVAGGDNTRGKDQMKLISAIVNQLSASTLLNNYSEILASLEGMFVTSMPAEKIGELVQTQIAEMPRWEIFSFAVTGTGGTDHCWASGFYAYVMYPHEKDVAHASSLIDKILSGEILTEADMTIPE